MSYPRHKSSTQLRGRGDENTSCASAHHVPHTENWPLESGGTNTSGKSVIHVKLTDSALQAVQNYIASLQINKNASGLSSSQRREKPTITFPSSTNTGVLHIPSNSSGASPPSTSSSDFKFTLSKSDDAFSSQTSFQCLQNVNGCLRSIANIEQKMQIQASGDSYTKFSQKMCNVKRESEIRSSRILDTELGPSFPSSSSHHHMNQNRKSFGSQSNNRLVKVSHHSSLPGSTSGAAVHKNHESSGGGVSFNKLNSSSSSKFPSSFNNPTLHHSVVKNHQGIGGGSSGINPPPFSSSQNQKSLSLKRTQASSTPNNYNHQQFKQSSQIFNNASKYKSQLKKSMKSESFSPSSENVNKGVAIGGFNSGGVLTSFNSSGNKKSSSSSSSASSSTANPEIMRRPLKERIIHLLAIRPYKKPEIFLRLNREGIREKDKKSIISILLNVSTMKDNTFHLLRHIWNDVSDTWPFYSEQDRQCFRRRKPQNLTPPCSDGSNYSSMGQSPDPQDDMQVGDHLSKGGGERGIGAEFGHNHQSSVSDVNIHKQMERGHGKNKLNKNDDGDDEINYFSTKNHLERNQSISSSVNLESEEVGGEMRGSGLGMYDDDDENSYDFASLDKHFSSQPRGHADYAVVRQDEPPVKRPHLVNVVDDTTTATTSTSGVETSPSSVKKIVLETKEERDSYKQRFNSKYTTYLDLHCKVSAASNKFLNWQKEMVEMRVGSTEYDEMRNKIFVEYDKMKGEKIRFMQLHTELSDIKRLVSDFDMKNVIKSSSFAAQSRC